MQVKLKLFASLGHLLPPGAERNVARVDIDENTTIWSLLDRFRVPRESCHLVMMNGIFQPPEVRGEVTLAEGDELAVWPPIAGG